MVKCSGSPSRSARRSYLILCAYVQKFIERRFNLQDREAVEAFIATLREEIDLEQLRERFLTIIQRTMQPSSVSVWIRTSPEQQEKSDSTEEIMVADSAPGSS
ncbi:MAG: hypothetical protein ACJ8CB_23850 [Ktedonobacteraceae bacterium]